MKLMTLCRVCIYLKRINVSQQLYRLPFFPSIFVIRDEASVKRESVMEEPHPAHIFPLQKIINNLYMRRLRR